MSSRNPVLLPIVRRRARGCIAGGEACIVGAIFAGAGRFFAEQPGPEAALVLRLTRSVVNVIRILLRIAPDHSRRYFGSFEILDGSVRGRRIIEGSDNRFSHQLTLCLIERKRPPQASSNYAASL